LKCKKRPKYWVRRMDKSIYHDIPYPSNWWYPLCTKHLKKIIKNSKFEIIALKTERVREFEHKIFCSRDSHITDFKNWKMFIDWEEIASELDVEKPVTLEVYRALQKYYLNNYLKVKKRIEKRKL
jgi:hypothetical protein